MFKISKSKTNKKRPLQSFSGDNSDISLPGNTSNKRIPPLSEGNRKVGPGGRSVSHQHQGGAGSSRSGGSSSRAASGSVARGGSGRWRFDAGT